MSAIDEIEKRVSALRSMVREVDVTLSGLAGFCERCDVSSVTESKRLADAIDEVERSGKDYIGATDAAEQARRNLDAERKERARIQGELLTAHRQLRDLRDGLALAEKQRDAALNQAAKWEKFAREVTDAVLDPKEPRPGGWFHPMNAPGFLRDGDTVETQDTRSSVRVFTVSEGRSLGSAQIRLLARAGQ